MKLSSNGLNVIKDFEGLRLDAYRDEAGVWTIGYGSSRYHDGKQVKPGDKLANEAQADALLRNTLDIYENAVNTDVKVSITQNQFDALVSFAYNVGTGALKESSLLTLLNQQDYEGAAKHFLLWDKIKNPNSDKKIVSKTLHDRRKQESQLFLKPY